MVHTGSLLITWLILAVAVWLAAAVVPGVQVKGAGGVLVVSAVYGVLNTLLGWFFVAVIGIATLGIGFLLLFLTRWIVNALLLKLTDAVTEKLAIRSFGSALLASLVISVVGTLGEALVRGMR